MAEAGRPPRHNLSPSYTRYPVLQVTLKPPGSRRQLADHPSLALTCCQHFSNGFLCCVLGARSSDLLGSHHGLTLPACRALQQLWNPILTKTCGRMLLLIQMGRTLLSNPTSLLRSWGMVNEMRMVGVWVLELAQHLWCGRSLWPLPRPAGHCSCCPPIAIRQHCCGSPALSKGCRRVGFGLTGPLLAKAVYPEPHQPTQTLNLSSGCRTNCRFPEH